MCKVEVITRLVGLNKNMFAADPEVLADMVKPIMNSEYEDLRKYALTDKDDRGINHFNLFGFYMMDYYSSNDLKDTVLQNSSRKWFERLSEQFKAGDFGFIPNDEYIKHVSNLLTLHHNHFHSIMIENGDKINNDTNTYIMFHIFVDKDLISHFKSLESTIYDTDEIKDPYMKWPLSRYMAEIDIFELSENMSDKTYDITGVKFDTVIMDDIIVCDGFIDDKSVGETIFKN